MFKTRTVTVSHGMVSSARAIVAKYNRRLARVASRYGLELSPLEIGVSESRLQDDPMEKGKKYLVVDITVSGDDCRVGGWEFAAVLTATDEGYLASSLQGDLLDLSSYASRGGDCDHCKAARRRTTTYVLRQGEELKVVGSSCVGDFTGSTSAAGQIANADVLAALRAEMDDWEETGERGARQGQLSRVFDLSHYLSFVRVSIRRLGWTSKTNSGGKIPTANLAMEAVLAWEAHTAHGTTLNPELLMPEDSDRKDAEHDIDFLLKHLEDIADSDRDDFQNNLLLVLRQGYVFPRNSGMAAAICRTVDKLLGQDARETETPDLNEHFGEIGDRRDYTLTVIRDLMIDGTFGATQLCIFTDKEGRRAKWFNSSRKLLTPKTTYVLKGTVKAHELYKDRKITTLSRCKVVSSDAQPE
jgi:hypothetical protein